MIEFIKTINLLFLIIKIYNSSIHRENTEEAMPQNLITALLENLADYAQCKA